MLLRKTYGIDLGSSTIKVYSFLKNKSYMEKNMVASKGHTIIAIGNEAYEMFEKSPVNIAVNSPMTFGMIANLELQEIALYSMMKKIDKFLGIGSDMFFSVPLDMTAIEKRAYYHVVNGHWLRQNRVYMVEAPIADALAMGIRMEKNEGSMVVNIGAQSTQFSILTDGNIIMSRKVPIGGRQMNEAICAEIRKRYNLQIGTRTGKRLKIAMGRLNDQRKDARKVVGIDSISGLPREEIISGSILPVEVHVFRISTIIWQAIQAYPLIYRLSTRSRRSADLRRSSGTGILEIGHSPSNNVNYNFLRGMIHEKPEKEISISNTFKE